MNEKLKKFRPGLWLCLFFLIALWGCAAFEGEKTPESKYISFPTNQESGPDLREPVPWEKTVVNAPEMVSPKNSELENTDSQQNDKARDKPAAAYRYRQYQELSDINKKFGYPAGATYRRPDSVRTIDEKMRQNAKNEYRDDFDPRDMTTYQQYSRHHWSNRDRRPLDVYGPGRGFPLRPLK